MEVPDQVREDKFKVNDDYDFDKCRIAQWLRAIDTLNREADFSEFASDPVFRVLQNEVKLCNFSARYMISTMMRDVEKASWEYSGGLKKAREIAKNLRDNGVDISVIKEATKLSEKEIREL